MEEPPKFEVTLRAHEGDATLFYRPGVGGLWCHRFRVTLGPMTADVDAGIRADPAELAAGLNELLESRTLTGEINLSGFEPDVERVSIQLAYGKGSITIRVGPQFEADGFADMRLSIDQTGLRNALQELHQTLRRYAEA